MRCHYQIVIIKRIKTHDEHDSYTFWTNQMRVHKQKMWKNIFFFLRVLKKKVT